MTNLRTILTISALLMTTHAEETQTPACTDQQILHNGECQDCPTWTRAQENNSFCGQDKCDHETQVVRVDGTCNSCPEGYEPNINQVDCDKIGLTCEGNEAKSGDKCLECPIYTRPQSDHSYCGQDFCDKNSIILPTGKCQNCQAGFKPDLVHRRQCIVDKRNQECTDRQIQLKDHQGLTVCQDCPDFSRAQENNWYCSADYCSRSQIIQKDGTCLDCPSGQTPDFSRQKCKPVPTGLVEGSDEPNAAVLATSDCDSSWQVTLADGSCRGCPAYTKPQDNNECEADVCMRTEYLHDWGYCAKCPLGQVHDETGRGCEEPQLLILSGFEPVQCGERHHRSFDGQECFPCPDFTRAQDRNSRCAPDTCLVFQVLTADGKCSDCPQGSRPSLTQRSCIEIVDASSCNERQIYREAMNMCEQCGPFTRPQGDECGPDDCNENQKLLEDGSCSRPVCKSNEIVDRDGKTCDRCMPYTRPQPGGDRCAPDHCPTGITQYDGTCSSGSQYYTNFKVQNQQESAEPVAQGKGNGESISMLIIGVLSTMVLGLIAFIAYRFRTGSEKVPLPPPVQQNDEPRQVKYVRASRDSNVIQKEIEVGPTSKKLNLEEESMENVDVEIPRESNHDSVAHPISVKE